MIKGFQLLAVSSVIYLFLTVVIITPKIEKYSQNAAIEYMKSMRGKDVYVGTLYKSYAMLFYTGAMPSDNPKSLKVDWQLRGEIDKPAYFIVRKDKLEENLNRYKDLEFVEEKNGYGLLKRLPKNQNNTLQND
jgi:hypothetical protein